MFSSRIFKIFKLHLLPFYIIKYKIGKSEKFNNYKLVQTDYCGHCGTNLLITRT